MGRSGGENFGKLPLTNFKGMYIRIYSLIPLAASFSTSLLKYVESG